jgi:hypothetical protein
VPVNPAFARGAAGLLAVFWGLFFVGLVDLLAFLQGEQFHDTILLPTGWGPAVPVPRRRAVGRLVSGSRSVVDRREPGDHRRRGRACRHLIAQHRATFPVRSIGSSHDCRRRHSPRRDVCPKYAPVLALVGPARRGSSRRGRTRRPLLVDLRTQHRLGSAYRRHSRIRSRPVQAALPIAAVAVGHPRGWRLPAWSVAATGVWFGLVSLAEPNLVGSINRPWSAAVVAWSVVFVVAVQFSARPSAADGRTGLKPATTPVGQSRTYSFHAAYFGSCPETALRNRSSR